MSFSAFFQKSGTVLVDIRHDNLGGIIALGFPSSSSLSNQLIPKGVGQGTIFIKVVRSHSPFSYFIVSLFVII